MFETEASRLRALASRAQVRVRFTRHATEERQKDGIAEIDVLNMLSRCKVTLVEPSGADMTWRAEGSDVDGRPITAVVVVVEDLGMIRVITCWAGARR